MHRTFLCSRAQRELTSLSVCCSPISSPAAVATFLSNMFPRLQTIYAHWIRPPGGHKAATVRRWYKVDKLLKSGAPFALPKEINR